MRRKRSSKRRKSNLIFVLFILTFTYFPYALAKQGIKISEYEKELNSYTNKKQEIIEEISTLKKDYEKRETLEFAEKVAREKLGMIKPKEYLVKEK
ncbi:FtsB family cell division protein [Lagierella massiliensis]|uniref:FtsB family cell division protein n=1 Tax=Lagierella massiliensis TaxID=1689303 RepID=UPI0006D79E18|nr:septum formation initiator family protein [Lagierella massiliensis]